METLEQIKQDGIAKGMCRYGQVELSRNHITTERLARLYFKEIDFCIGKDVPTLEMLRQGFKGKCEPFGVYVDQEDVREWNREEVSLNGGCKAELFYNGFSVSRVFVRHTSTARVTARGYAHLTIDVFDNAKLAVAVAGTKARVLVNVYGNAQVECTGTVKIVNKNKTTY